MNSSKISAILLLSVAAVFAGCGKDDGSKDFAAGVKAMTLKDYNKAAQSFELAANKASTNVDAFIQLANARIQLGEIEAADAAAKSALALDPSNTEVLLLDGNVAFWKKDLDRAIADYEKVSEDESADADTRSSALCSRAVVEMSRGESELARLALYRALRLDRRNSQAYYHLGLLYRDTYRYDESALDQFECFIRLADASDEHADKVKTVFIPNLRAALSKANSAAGSARVDKAKSAKLLAAGEASAKKKGTAAARAALKNFEGAVAADPTSFAAAFRLANYLESTQKTTAGLTKALNAYKVAVEASPSSMAAYKGAVRVAFRLRHPATAAAILNRALAHAPGDAAIVDQLILAHTQAGDSNNLVEAYRAYKASLLK